MSIEEALLDQNIRSDVVSEDNNEKDIEIMSTNQNYVTS